MVNPKFGYLTKGITIIGGYEMKKNNQNTENESLTNQTEDLTQYVETLKEKNTIEDYSRGWEDDRL